MPKFPVGMQGKKILLDCVVFKITLLYRFELKIYLNPVAHRTVTVHQC